MADPETRERLASMETKIDFLVSNAETQRVDQRKAIEDHDKRLKVVERICWGFVAVGGAGLIGGGASVATATAK